MHYYSLLYQCMAFCRILQSLMKAMRPMFTTSWSMSVTPSTILMWERVVRAMGKWVTLCQSVEGGHCFLDGLLEERYASTFISLLIAILVDIQEFYYPTGVAYPIGGGGPRYIVMEVHYDNPQMRSGTFYFVNNYNIISILLLLQRLSFPNRYCWQLWDGVFVYCDSPNFWSGCSSDWPFSAVIACHSTGCRTIHLLCRLQYSVHIKGRYAQ